MTEIIPGIKNYIDEKELLSLFPNSRFHKIKFRGVYMLRTKTWQSDKDEYGNRPKYMDTNASSR